MAKKSFWERLGIAWASQSSDSDVQMLIAAPEAQLGFNLGLMLHGFFSNLPDDLRLEGLAQYPQTPESELGFRLGTGLANGINDFKKGVASVETRSLDEIDADRQEAAGTAPETVQDSIIAYTNNITQQVAETSRRRVQEEIKPQTTDELRKAAFAEYEASGDTDKLLENLGAIDSAEDIERQIQNAEYAYESAYFYGNEAGYYGIDSANAIQDLQASAGNDNLVPLYNVGLEQTFLENIPPERVIDYQLALVQAGFLDPGSFNPGDYDTATQQAVIASFSYMNPKAQFGIDSNDLQEIAAASGGNNQAFLGFIRDYYLDGLDDISWTETNPISQGPSIIALPRPELLRQQIDTAVQGLVGTTPNDTLYYGVQDWANGKIRELTQDFEESQRLYRNQARMAQEDALRRKKFGLPEKTYEITAAMTEADISSSFNAGLNQYVRSQYGDLIEQGQEESAYKNGIARLISAFSQR